MLVSNSAQAPIAAQVIDDQGEAVRFTRIPGKAQYGGSDYANAVRVERGITLAEALEIAANDPEIDYFFIMKDLQMVLNFVPGQVYEPAKDPLHLVQNGNMRIFRLGDAVFFKNEGKWLGDAGPFADVYEKV